MYAKKNSMITTEDAEVAEKRRRYNELEMKNYKTSEEDDECEELEVWLKAFDKTEEIINDEFLKFRTAQQQ